MITRSEDEYIQLRGVVPVEDDEREMVTADLKLKINNLLWTVLPPETTIGRAEEIACEWHRTIEDAWDSREEAINQTLGQEMVK